MAASANLKSRSGHTERSDALDDQKRGCKKHVDCGFQRFFHEPVRKMVVQCKIRQGDRKIYAKLHVIRNYRGRICAAIVTDGHAGDAPYLTKMMRMIPDGTGNVLGDAAYGSIENCEAVRVSGRKPYMALKKNSVAKRFNARAGVIISMKEYPGTHYKNRSKLCNVENAFSVSKCRFGGMVRVLNTQRIELPIMCVCFNTTFE